MDHEVTPNELRDHFMSPSYFDPEILKIATNWYTATEGQRRAYVREEGPSPIPMLREELALHGVTDPVEVMELIMLASGKFGETT